MNPPFANPQMFWLLPLIAGPLVAFYIWAWRRRQELIAQFVTSRLLAQLKLGMSPQRQKARMALVVAAVVLLIAALARPQWGVVMEEVRQRGLDIIVAIDTSNSMLAEDAPPNRLKRAKLAAMDLMHQAKSDRLGLIAFAGDAYLQCPLTLDDAAFSQSVDGLDTHTISEGGTALAEVIDTAMKAFKDTGESHKILVIFTDGEDHEGEAVARAEAAAKEGLRIFTVGIGSADGEKLRIRDERGRVDYLRDEQGNPVVSKLNEGLLQQIAKAAGGFYLPLRGTKTMDTLYQQGLAPLPKDTSATKMLRRVNEHFHWPLGLAIVLLLVEMFLPENKARRSSRTAATATAASAAGTALLLLLALAAAPAARADSNRAYKEYEAGKFEEALKDYEKLLQKQKDDPRLHFNAGAAAYQSRRLDEATNQFNQVLSAPDVQLQQRAYYNLGNTFYRLGEQAAADPAAALAAAAGGGGDPRMKAWEQAVQSYDNALKLNPQDNDAKFNQAYVKRQLEELKKQQQQQQQQSKDKKDQDKKDDKDKQDQSQQQKQDDKDQQQQQQKDQQPKDQQEKKDQQSGGQQQDQKQNQQSKQDQAEQKKAEQKKQEQKQAGEKKDQKDAAKQAQKSPEEQKKEQEEAEKEAAAMAAGQMTPQQAMQLLDAQKGEDEVLKMPAPNKNQAKPRSLKNW